jgi:hypothetical protein
MRTVNLAGRAVRALIASLAVLLPAGVWAAVAVNGVPSTTIAAGARVGATGLGSVLLDKDQATGLAPVVSVAPTTVSTTTPVPTTATSTTKPAAKSTTTTKAPATSGTAATLPAGVPPPNLPVLTKIPNIPPATSWDVQQNGVSARMWIEPTVPVAGQPVRFHIDYASAEPCCTIMLDFGDGSGGYGLNTSRTCSEPSPYSPGPHSVVTSHTFAAAGAYKGQLTVMAKDLCDMPPMVLGSPPPQPDFDAVSTTTCIAVGAAGQKGCSPFPPFAPDQLVSPVIDPFCQVRSDCTKASTPRPGWDT